MNLGRVGWAPGYVHIPGVAPPPRRKGKPRGYLCPCGNAAVNVFDSAPPRGWRWDSEAEAWICDDCAREAQA